MWREVYEVGKRASLCIRLESIHLSTCLPVKCVVCVCSFCGVCVTGEYDDDKVLLSRVYETRWWWDWLCKEEGKHAMMRMMLTVMI